MAVPTQPTQPTQPTHPAHPAKPPSRRRRMAAGSARAAVGGVVWFDDRLGLGRWLRPNLRKLFPSHWSFLLGEFALYSFALLVLTGTFLTFWYQATPSQAYDSVVEISLDVRGGLLIRQMHHWAATIFVLSIVAHLCRVFFTGAFRRPRELTWVIGVILFALVLFESFLGFSLPGDTMGFAGLREADSLLLAIPLVGTYLSMFVFGGPFPGDAIPRLFVTHVLLIPGILLALVPLHALVLTWRQKHTEKRLTGASERRVTGGPFFPYFAAKQGVTSLGTFAVITALATFVVVNPVWENGVYTPGAKPPGLQPFWYYGVLDGALRLMPAWQLGPLDLGLLIPMLMLAVFFAVLLVYPFLERRLTGDRGVHHLLERPAHAPVRTALGVAVLTFFTVIWAATWFSAPGRQHEPLLPVSPEAVPAIMYGLRVAVFVLPPIAYAITLAVCRRRAGG
ncbi:cytochrome b [Thermoactinospora rubra]|uniref:cytochrome b n=1 Tax=Thermoactinospora rubra TaxID=1088767 RepID=UPI000A0F6270|nr:cytochrome bc complex cytochrome b subunit [Thermoactinospora rubra]